MSVSPQKAEPRVLALINARGGSKGIPGKNIRLLGEKPLIAWSIELALRCPSVASVVVSTNSPEIADVARANGARVPFIRPADLASDTSLQIDAVRHAIGFLEEQGETYDIVVILQPTVPFRMVEDVEGVISLLIGSGASSVITVTEVSGKHPMTMYRMGTDQSLAPLLEANSAGVLRQEFPRIYWRTGSVYAVQRDVVMNLRSLYGSDTRGYAVPEDRSINIDSLLDWDYAELYLRRSGAAHGAPAPAR